MVELRRPGQTVEAPADVLSIELLGGFRVRFGTHAVPESAWRLQKAKSLVKLLALSPSLRLPRERAVDLLWPDLDPEAANNNLYQTLHNARRALASSDSQIKLSLRHGIIALEPSSEVRVDVDEFEKAAAAARRSDDVALYRQALDLYAGDLLPDDLYEDFVIWRREGLSDTRVVLLTELARRYEARGELHEAMETLRKAIQADPLREEVHVELMRLYASTGQRSKALTQFDLLKEVLADQLEGTPDDTTVRIRQAILEGQYGADEEAEHPVESAPRHNLPLSLTSFVGRAEELGELKSLLDVNRLVTVIGSGGTGKTRLALRAGWDLLEKHRDGVWVVRLATLTDPALLERSVAGVLGVGEQSDPGEALLDKLATAEILLILDNCEHLADSCRQLAFRLLPKCPGLRILATSRRRLGLMGEVTVDLHPLSYPLSANADVEVARGFEAVQLFVDRARFRQPAFALSQDTVAGVTRICRQVEGMPLALELAASRVGSLGVNQIAERLTDSEALLETTDHGEDERHRSLRATLDWSYQLLDDEERRVFRMFAVFQGGCLLEQAEAVLALEKRGKAETFEVVSRLVDQSLIKVEGASEGVVRYRFLQPIKQYALHKLREAGEEQQARRCHAVAYMDFVRPAAEELRRSNARLWLDRLENEHANLRAAIHWSLETGDFEPGLRIVGAIWRFWVNRGYVGEGRQLTGSLLALAEQTPDPDACVLADAFNAGGSLAYYQSDTDEARVMYEKSVALRRRTGDDRGAAATLSNLGLVAKDQGQPDRARELFQESIKLFRKLGVKRGIASSLGNLGILLQEIGDFDGARPLLEESLDLAQDEGRTGTVVTSMNNLAALALEQGDYERARELLTEVLALSKEVGASRSFGVAALNLGRVEQAQGNLRGAIEHYRSALALFNQQGEKAAIAQALERIASALIDSGNAGAGVRLLGAAHRLGWTLSDVERTRLERIITRARDSLGENFEKSWEAGRRASLEGVIASAMGDDTAVEHVGC